MAVREQPSQQLWGAETSKAVANFPVSGERVPLPVIHWLARIKAASARVNAELGLLDRELADPIAEAADGIAAGRYDDQFPIDVFQTGSGTSSNMNANEVIANLAGEGAHPNDHVNMGQSSGRVEEVALAHRSLLLLDDCGALALQHEEGLGLAFPVVEAVRLAGLEDADVERQVPKARLALEADGRAEAFGAKALRLGEVDDEPALARGDDTGFGLGQLCLGDGHDDRRS